MLAELRIKNLAVVEELSFTPGPGLNVLSGETGAGKSIVVGAIELLLGGRADVDAVRTGADLARIEGLFKFDDPDFFKRRGIDQELPDGQLVLVREIQKSGRSRALVNDQMATVARLKTLGEAMADLHGQHEHQRLLKPESHVDYLDRYGLVPGPDGKKPVPTTGGLTPLEAWRAARERWQEAVRRLAALDGVGGSVEERRKGMADALADLDAAGITPGEEAELKADRTRMMHAEKLMTAVAGSLEELDEGEPSIEDRLGEIARRLTQAGALDPRLVPMAEGIERGLVELQDSVRDLVRYRDELSFEPDRAARIEERLALIGRLKKVHATDEGGLVEKSAALRKEIDLLADETRARAALDVEKSRAAEALVTAGRELKAWRTTVGERLVRGVGHELATLGMKGAVVSVRMTPNTSATGIDVDGVRLEPTEKGFESIEFDLAANPGEEPRPLARVASGGELSRVMLAMKAVLRAVDPLPILLFDEVDSGIGGRVAVEVGQRLKEIAVGRQVLVITHLPMIAAPADRHFRVVKEVKRGRTLTTIEALGTKEREEELARMMAGAESPDEARRTARALLEGARRGEPMIFVVDNYDSFTFNLVQYLAEMGAEVQVARNDEVTPEEILARKPTGILISPGPGTPADAGISKALITAAANANVPLLGVCLGHQALGEVYGGRVVRAARLMHGKTSPILHDGKDLFAGLPNPFTATRYHSLIVAPEDLPDVLTVTAWTAEKEIMGLTHRTHRLWGVQFHPESILTESGKALMKNFLEMTGGA